jgi:TldD protein
MSQENPQGLSSKPLSRRDLLKGAAAGGALAMLPVALNAEGLKASTPGHFQRFGVDEALVRKALSEALSRGGDYAEIYFQHTVGNYMGLEDGIVSRAYTSVDFGAGIRVIKGDQVGYSFTEDLSPRALCQAARTAASIASGPAHPGPRAFKLLKHPDHYAIQLPWASVQADRKVPLLRTVNDRIFALDGRVLKVRANYQDEDTRVLIATSEGFLAEDHRPMCTLSASCVAEQNKKREQGYSAISGRQDFSLLDAASLENLAKEAVRLTVVGFDAVKPEGGEMEVVLAPGASGILLHEAIGHGLEADFNRKAISIFSDKLGKKVAEPFVTIVDDATLPHTRGALNVDDEGQPTQKTVLVENGTLVSYMHDRISAQHYKLKSTGNGRRESFRHAPIPRMRCTYMEPGPHEREEIIRSVKKGIYAETFTNGQVNIGAGDFTFYVKTGYLIEDGKLTRPIKDVNIIGSGPEVLRKVVMVGKDLKIDQGTWTCGKDGQGAPVSQGLPTVKVSSITVGGVRS